MNVGTCTCNTPNLIELATKVVLEARNGSSVDEIVVPLLGRENEVTIRSLQEQRIHTKRPHSCMVNAKVP